MWFSVFSHVQDYNANHIQNGIQILQLSVYKNVVFLFRNLLKYRSLFLSENFVDIFSKTFAILNALTNALTLPGLLMLCAFGLLASVWAMMRAKGRMLFFVLAVLCYALSMDRGRGETSRVPLPDIILTVAYALKWIFIIPLVLYGVGVTVVGRGASSITVASFLMVCLYIFGRAFMSGSWDRYFLWILMIIGLPGLGATLCRELGAGTVFRYQFWLAYMVLGFAMLQFIIRPGTALSGIRYTGFLPNPNSMGALLSCVIVPGIWMFFEKSRTKFVIVVLAVLGFMLLATGSRAALCQIFPAVILVVLLYSRKPVMWIFFVSVIGLLFLVATFFISDEIMQRFTSTSTSGRVELWQEYWRIGMDNPVLGKGMGWIESADMMAPHNGFIFLFVESGLIGMVLMSAAFLLAVFHNVGRKYYYLFPDHRRVRWFVFAQLFGFLISGFFESWFIGIGYFEMVMFLLIIGIKDELDRNVFVNGRAYWDSSLFISSPGQNLMANAFAV